MAGRYFYTSGNKNGRPAGKPALPSMAFVLSSAIAFGVGCLLAANALGV